MAREPGLHHELVLIDQSQLRQRQRELHASHEQSLTRLLLKLLNGRPQIPPQQLRVPIDPLQRARHDVLLCRVDRPGEGSIQSGLAPGRAAAETLPPSWRRSPGQRGAHRPGRGSRPRDDAGLRPGDRSMIAAPVQCDVDGIPKGSHYSRVPVARPYINTRAEREPRTLN